MTTASSLVERLEAAAHAWENSLTVRRDIMASPAMLREAKVEIERLRVIMREMGEALEFIADWSQVKRDMGISKWKGCVVKANQALAKYKELTK
jgi:hypothetical protein